MENPANEFIKKLKKEFEIMHEAKYQSDRFTVFVSYTMLRVCQGFNFFVRGRTIIDSTTALLDKTVEKYIKAYDGEWLPALTRNEAKRIAARNVIAKFDPGSESVYNGYRVVKMDPPQEFVPSEEHYRWEKAQLK